MKCPNCGADNSEGRKFCGECGSKLDSSLPRTCVGCGRTISWDAMICQHCGYDYRPQLMGVQPSGRTVPRQLKTEDRMARPSLRSTLLCVAVIVTGIWALAYAVIDYSGSWTQVNYELLETVVGASLVVLGILALGLRK